MMDDGRVVAWQLGRAPRGRWRVAARCSQGYPTCIATAPVLENGEPFPTLFYLTCPHLVAEVAEVESRGALDTWRVLLAADESVGRALRDADTTYRAARAAEGGGVDPTPDVGIAGQKDTLALKCLHAHVAAFLGGIDDPVGRATMREFEPECSDRRCEEA